MVPRAGLEPARSNEQRILSPLCLPFHHLGILAGKVGFEPTTNRLTADRSTAELLASMADRVGFEPTEAFKPLSISSRAP